MKILRSILFAATLFFASALPSIAQQSAPNWTFNYVPTPAEWNFWFGKKVDWQGSAPCAINGCTMLGPLITAASTAPTTGFNITPGVAPTTPNNGDMWVTATGIFARVNGVTQQLCGGCGSSTASIVDLGSGTNEPPSVAGAGFQLYGADTVATRFEVTTFGNTAVFSTRASGGTRLSPTAVTAGTLIGAVNMFAWDGTSWTGPTPGASIHLYAETSTWTSANHPGEICLATNPAGSAVAPVDIMCVHQNAVVTITSAAAQSLAVGPNGTTSPTFQVNASASSAATGISVVGAASGNGVTINVISPATNENLTISPKGSGFTTLTGGFAVNGNVDITSSITQALTAGPNGTTNPTFNVDASTASSATGLNVKGAAAAGGVALSAISSGTNESMTIDAKGTGHLTLNGTATGGILIGSPTGGDKGTGTLNLSGGLFINGSAISGTGTVTTPGAGLVSSVTAGCSQAAGGSTLSRAECLNPQTGTTYTVVDGDRAKLVTFSNTSPVAVTLPQAGASTSFMLGWYAVFCNINTGTVTITPTTSTIDTKASIQLTEGQCTRPVSDGANYTTTSGQPWVTNSLSANVAMTTANTFFNGPAVAQGAGGTWYASATITLKDTAAAGNIDCKLTDGTTIFDTARTNPAGASFWQTVSLSGVISNPVAGILIQCRSNTTTASMLFNDSGLGKDSTLTAIRLH